MTDDLIEFLRARLDEDEQVARAVDDRSEPWTGQWKVDAGALRTYNDWVLAFPHDRQPLRLGLVEHWARHDPARVLAEVAAKRRILGWADSPALPDYERNYVLTALAAPYASHPDFRADWAA